MVWRLALKFSSRCSMFTRYVASNGLTCMSISVRITFSLHLSRLMTRLRAAAAGYRLVSVSSAANSKASSVPTNSLRAAAISSDDFLGL